MERRCPDPDDAAGVDQSRRRYLGATAAVVSVGLAGCNDILGGGGGGGPEAAVERFADAMDRGDREAMENLIHPDSPQAGQLTNQTVSGLAEADVTLESTEVVEQGDGRATVNVTITLPANGQEQTTEQQWELRTHEGEWKLYQ